VAPPIGCQLVPPSVDSCHWTVGEPEAVDSKLTEWPSSAAALEGCLVTFGAATSGFATFRPAPAGIAVAREANAAQSASEADRSKAASAIRARALPTEVAHGDTVIPAIFLSSRPSRDPRSLSVSTHDTGRRGVVEESDDETSQGPGRVGSAQLFEGPRLLLVSDADDELFGAEHVRVYRETGGERGYEWRGTTILLLSTTGRRSRQERTTPLIHRTDGERWIVVASKGGAPEHPGWFENLQADPKVTIQVRAETIPVIASVAEGAEHERLWDLMCEVWPAYADYQRKTERAIPVVILSPRD
jgi:deazaflavin-dependent oxidoreductase (nitroreductase family)